MIKRDIHKSERHPPSHLKSQARPEELRKAMQPGQEQRGFADIPDEDQESLAWFSSEEGQEVASEKKTPLDNSFLRKFKILFESWNRGRQQLESLDKVSNQDERESMEDLDCPDVQLIYSMIDQDWTQKRETGQSCTPGKRSEDEKSHNEWSHSEKYSLENHHGGSHSFCKHSEKHEQEHSGIAYDQPSHGSQWVADNQVSHSVSGNLLDPMKSGGNSGSSFEFSIDNSEPGSCPQHSIEQESIPSHSSSEENSCWRSQPQNQYQGLFNGQLLNLEVLNSQIQLQAQVSHDDWQSMDSGVGALQWDIESFYSSPPPTFPSFEAFEEQDSWPPDWLSQYTHYLPAHLWQTYMGGQAKIQEVGEIVQLQEEIKKQTPCVVCLQMMEEKLVLKLGCGHIFHFECMEPWVKITNTCPTCRAKF